MSDTLKLLKRTELAVPVILYPAGEELHLLTIPDDEKPRAGIKGSFLPHW